MSYTISAYVVDVDALRRVYGSHDTQLVQAIEHHFEDDIGFYNEQAADLFGEETITINQALEEIIRGGCSQRNLWQYGCALEFVCQYLGEALPNDQFEALGGAGLGMVDDLEGVGDLIFRSTPPIPIPLLEDGIQHIGHMTYESAREQLAQLRGLRTDTADETSV